MPTEGRWLIHLFELEFHLGRCVELRDHLIGAKAVRIWQVPFSGRAGMSALNLFMRSPFLGSKDG